MREIKFRAWDSDNKVFSFFSFSNLEELIEQMDSFKEYFGNGYFSYVDEETGNPLLMQDTGLLDKNGKNIYDGDIVDIKTIHAIHGSFTGNEIVEWDKENAGYKAGLISFNFYANNWNDLSIDWIEIIGNIYENPELIQNYENN